MNTTQVTLAQLIKQTRESLNITPEALSEQTLLSLQTIEDLESGIQLFLSPSQRQKLARGLKLAPRQLRNLEKEQPIQSVSDDKKLILSVQIKRNPQGQFSCPQCQSNLLVREFERRDLEDNLILTYKVNCSKCPFHLTQE